MPGSSVLCLCMSGAGVAFPAQFFSVHCRCVALHFFSKALPGFAFAMQPHALAFLCKSGAEHDLAYLSLSCTRLFFSRALRVQALPLPCGDKRCRSHAWRCHSGAKRHEAIPGHFIALHCPALPSLSELCQCLVLLCYSAAPHRPATPSRCEASPCLCLSWPSFSGAYLLGPLPASFSP